MPLLSTPSHTSFDAIYSANAAIIPSKHVFFHLSCVNKNGLGRSSGKDFAGSPVPSLRIIRASARAQIQACTMPSPLKPAATHSPEGAKDACVPRALSSDAAGTVFVAVSRSLVVDGLLVERFVSSGGTLPIAVSKSKTEVVYRRSRSPPNPRHKISGNANNSRPHLNVHPVLDAARLLEIRAQCARHVCSGADVCG